MKVICKENKVTSLNLGKENIIYPNNYRFSLVKEKEYIVMGIVIYKDSNCIYYLVDEYEHPTWIPYIFFEISDKELSPNWFVKVFDKNESEDLFCLSGFNEMCNDEDYYDALVDREKWALDIYFKRKYEVQEWYFEKG